MTKKDEKPLSKLFWLDMEMTGLDENVDSILEVAVIITDLDLKELDKYEAVVFQTPDILEKMNEWCKKTHGASGLTKLVATGTALGQVEKDLLTLLDKHFDKNERVILCGNSISNDRRFIDKYMKNFANKLHYRLIDVSSFKEIFKAKFGIKVQKKNTHRAIDDIYESINELNTYLGYIKTEAQPK